MGWIEDKIRRCRSRACEEALLFVSDNLFRTRRNTLDIMDQVPSGWSGLNKLVREYVRKSMVIYRGLVFEDEIRHAVIEGYHSALRGISTLLRRATGLSWKGSVSLGSSRGRVISTWIS